MTIKTLVSLLLIEICASSASAADVMSVEQITNEIITSATAYANSISCPHVKITPQRIAALVPWKEPDDRWDARYAALWDGDIGCDGGSGGESTRISIVAVKTGNTFVVDPLRSSPAIRFEIPVRYVTRIVGNTHDSLVLEGLAYGPNDGNCCPSIRLRFTMQVDENGNWRVSRKQVLTPAKNG